LDVTRPESTEVDAGGDHDLATHAHVLARYPRWQAHARGASRECFRNINPRICFVSVPNADDLENLEAAQKLSFVYAYGSAILDAPVEKIPLRPSPGEQTG